MAQWHESVPAGHVLDIQTGLERQIAPPRELETGSRVAPGARRVISFLSGMVALGSIVGVPPPKKTGETARSGTPERRSAAAPKLSSACA